MSILAIDPGNTFSGYAIINPQTCQPIGFGKIPNTEILDLIGDTRYNQMVNHVENAAYNQMVNHVVIEMIASYGMPVGAEVFETCVWIGRFQQALIERRGITPELIKRHPVKMHHCHSARAKDSNITQALVDRFAPGAKNHGKGTKADPGWFHGFHADIWQAYALAVYTADTLLIGTRTV